MTFKDLTKKLRILVKNIESKSLYNEIGEKVSSGVKKRTRRGFGVKKDGDAAKKLKALSNNYKKKRKNLKKTGKLSSEATPGKSNLTQTGKMIDSVSHRATSNSSNIFIQGDENQKKARHQADEGREFMNLSRRELKDVEDIIAAKIENDIRKNGL